VRPRAAATAGPRRPWLLALLGLIALGVIGGGVAALTLGGGGTKANAQPPSVSVRTVTQPGTTVVTTAPAATTPATTAAATQPASGDPYALNNQAFELMKQGDYKSALPMLQSAVSQLHGRTDLGTAYANYNLGLTLVKLGRCGEAMPYLETSRSLQPQRHEVKDAIKQAKQCSG
jgi:TolA-binding protein